MDNVLQDMVQRLRAIELLLRTQNELLTRVLAEVKQTRRCAEESTAPAEPYHTLHTHRSPVFCGADRSPRQSEMLRSLARMNLVSTQHALLPC